MVTSSYVMDKGQISKAFSLQGLQLKPDAMKYLIGLVSEQGSSDIVEQILHAIDKNTCK
jgi:hypothetical protein